MAAEDPAISPGSADVIFLSNTLPPPREPCCLRPQAPGGIEAGAAGWSSSISRPGRTCRACPIYPDRSRVEREARRGRVPASEISRFPQGTILSRVRGFTMMGRMARDTLLDFFEDLAGRDEPFLVHDDGYPSREMSYRADGRTPRVVRAAGWRTPASGRTIRSSSGAKTATSGSSPSGDACSRGAVLVPVDYRASGNLLRRIVEIVTRKWCSSAKRSRPRGRRGAMWQLADRDADFAGHSPESTRRSPASRSPRSSSRQAPPPTRKA